jgi:type I restriction enzyme S subunit
VGSDLEGGFVSQHVAILRPQSVEPQWVAYSLYASRAQDQLFGGQYGGTKQQLGLDDLAELRISRPDRDEQHRRIHAMTQVRLAGERLASCLENQIALLTEHRQALITAAVTGELNIPGVAA